MSESRDFLSEVTESWQHLKGSLAKSREYEERNGKTFKVTSRMDLILFRKIYFTYVVLCPEIPIAVRVGTGSDVLLTECVEDIYRISLLFSSQALGTDTSATWTKAGRSKQRAKGRLKI